MDRDAGDTSGEDAAVEAAAELARLDRGAVPGSEDPASIDPAVSGPVTVSILLLLADLECGHAQVGQWQRCLRGLGLDLAADELVTNALELFPYV